jgi:eukaryotic-like serine/threonine-protein kinase
VFWRLSTRAGRSRKLALEGVEARPYRDEIWPNMSETVALTQGLPSHIRPGLIIAGKYRLEQEIGRGSMGTVYRAVHVTLGQRVAIKLISAEHSQSAEARHRFSVEAKAAAKLRSRHVVTVYDDGETEEGNPYIVLELLEGETLEQRLARDHDMPLAEGVRIVTHVGRALARAHAQGIVHRDLKPANIFLVKTDDDEQGFIAKVLDFGIAKLESQNGEKGTTQAGTVLGTPLFMSPEQVRGASSVDHRADLYSLGMCMFHMLTGEYAFYSPNYSEILVGICTQPLPSLRTKAPWLPEAIEQWFQRACAKEPLERFQSADEMTEALQAAAGGSTPLSKHKSFPEGRIAPETLMGYAAPALATVHNEASPAGLSRTQLLPHAAANEPQSAPVAISIGGESRASATGSEWLPPRRNFRPLLIGIGLGLLTVGTVAILFKLLSTPAPLPVTASGSASAAPPARAIALPREPTPSLAIEPPRATPTVSSVAAGTVSTSAPGRLLKPEAPAKAPSPTKVTPAAPSPASAPPKSAGSDLGF